MKRLLIILSMFFFGATLFAQTKTENSISSEEKDNPFFNLNKIYEIADVIYSNGWFSIKKNIDITPEDFFISYKEQMGLGKDDEMVLSKVNEDNYGIKHYRFRQFYKGVPVESGEYILHVKNNRVDHANGKIVTGLDFEINKSSDESSAFNSALNEINATKYTWEGKKSDKSDESRPIGSFVITQLKGTNKINKENSVFAYKYSICATDPFGNYTVYVKVDDKTVIKSHNSIDSPSDDIQLKKGDVDDKSEENDADKATTDFCNAQSCVSLYYGTEWFTATKKDQPWPLNDTYHLYDHCGANGYVSDIDAYKYKDQNDFSLYVEPWNTAQGGYKNNDSYWGSQDNVGTSAFWAVQRSRNFFEDRGQLLGGGRTIKLFCDWPESALFNGNNITEGGSFYQRLPASYDYDVIIIGEASAANSEAIALDNIAHEVSHMYMYYTLGTGFDPTDFYESLALAEGFADIYGARMEYGFTGEVSEVYTLGEKMSAIPIRSMVDPHIVNNLGTPQPKVYLEFGYWNYDIPDPHINGGVLTKWFYLLAHGENFNSYNIPGIGMVYAFEIVDYAFQANYIQSSSKYIDARMATELAAIELFGSCSNQVRQVIDAWDAVGVPTGNAIGMDIANTIYTNNALIYAHHFAGFDYDVFGISLLRSQDDVYTAGAPNNNTIFRSTERIELKTGFKTGNATTTNTYFHAYLEDCSSKSLLVVPDNYVDNYQINTDKSVDVIEDQQISEKSVPELSIFPNPGNGYYKISHNANPEELMRIRICSINGSIVFEANELMNNSIIDISNQAKGIYYVRVTAGQEVFIKKVIYQ